MLREGREMFVNHTAVRDKATLCDLRIPWATARAHGLKALMALLKPGHRWFLYALVAVLFEFRRGSPRG